MNMKNKQIRNITFSALLIAVGLVLPQLFHAVGGQTAGTIFLPLHIPVFVAGLLLGPAMGGSIGLLLPFVSSLMTGMPPALRLPFMMVELCAYGVISGLIMKQTKNALLSLIVAQVGGRIFYALSLIIAANILKIPAPALTAFLMGITNGLPGLGIQWVLIPLLVKLLKDRVEYE